MPVLQCMVFFNKVAIQPLRKFSEISREKNFKDWQKLILNSLSVYILNWILSYYRMHYTK